MNKIRYLTICFFVVLLIPSVVYSYDILNTQTPSDNFVFFGWPDPPIDLILDPGTLGGSDGRATVETACNVWNSVANTQQLCGNLFAGSEDITVDNFDSAISMNDGIIDVIFDETGAIIAEFGLSPTITLGLSSTLVNALTGEIVDVLMVLNGSLLSSSGSDLQSTTVHEMGHGWGLAHTPIGGINNASTTIGLEPIDPIRIPTMFPFNIPVNDAFGITLEIDDEVGISVRYPRN
ncbi:hypothetical protein MYX76_06915 [Desulfobacterota bacterium AH_259_B03_O07]|nr:hypothetical protein [Desulfobacterota bacterium AH_259_B03_O07]